MSSQPAPTNSDPFNFNLPSPLPLPSISDTTVVNFAPSSTFSFSPTLTQPLQLVQTSTLRNSNNLQDGRLPPSIPATYPLIPNLTAPAPTTSVTSPSFSLQHVATRVRPPAFYTSSFRLSHMYSQQPPCASWATHRQYNTFSPFYSLPNPPIHQHFQQNFPTSPSQPTFFPPQPHNVNIGLQYRDRPAHIYSRDVSMSMLQQARLQEQQQHAMMQYTASQHRMMMIQPLRSPFQQPYQQIVSPVPVPVSPSHALGIRAPQEFPSRYSDIFPTPPGLQTPSRQQVPWSSCNAISFSGVTPERYLVPEERTIVGVHRPQHSSIVLTPPTYTPQCVRPPPTRSIDVPMTVTQGEQIPVNTENQQAQVVIDSPSLPVSQPAVTSHGIKTPVTVAPSKTSAIIRPVPIRPLPSTSIFSWPRPAACHTLPAVVSPSTPAIVTISHLAPVCREGESPTEHQIRKSLGDGKKQRAATDAPVKLPAGGPSSSGGSLEDAQSPQSPHGEVMYISEGDMDVGEQVVVETERRGNNRTIAADKNRTTAADKKLEEYKSFVSYFKYYRSSLGYSLVDVMQQVGHRYGKRITLRLITNFEDLVLDKRSYIPLMETLSLWVKDTAKANKEDTTNIATLQYHSIVPPIFRKRRTWLNAQVIRGLEEEFANKKNPTASEVKKMAEEWKVEKDYVRSWFCSRRRRERKRYTACARMPGPEWSTVTPQAKGTKIPSLTYDITIEVSSHHPRDHWCSSPYTINI